MRKYREFNVGDQVMVVSKPYMDCPFSWIPDMDRMCGKLVTIRSKSYNDSNDTYLYKVKEDPMNYSWCGNCFVLPEPEEELPEIEDESFLSAIHMGGGEDP